MTAGTDIITAAVTAARAGDLDALRQLVDWPLTGAAEISRALPGVDEGDRASGAASGLRELAEAADSTDLVAEILQPLAGVLAGARGVRAATPPEASVALAAVRVPEVPPGLTDEQMTQFAQLRARADTVTEVYVVSGDTGDLTVLRAPDTGLLVLLLE